MPRTKTLLKAASLPVGSNERRALLQMLADDDMDQKLTLYAKQQYAQAAEMGDTEHERDLILAVSVGRQAARLGMTPKQLTSWLQKSYGSVWVALSGLRPGADLKEILKTSLKAMGR